MEYYKDYKGIDFRVSYSLSRHCPGRLGFAAQPFERMADKEPKADPKDYLMYGMVENGETLQVGFNGFAINMTESFHSRLGLLYEVILKEYGNVVLKDKQGI